MTDTAKATILGVGITIAVGLVGIILKPFSLLMLGIVTGPGLLTEGLIGRYLHQGTLLWLIGAIPQFIIIYFISLLTYRHPPFWPLRIGLLVFTWVGAGYLGWLIVR